jgi:hypothetical protein
VDNFLFDEIHKSLPKFNERVCRGLAVVHLKEAMAHVKGVMKCASKSFPKGLVFEDVVRCNPREEYAELTRKRYGKHQIELAQSDVYLVKFLFSYDNGEGSKQLPPKFMFLPNVSSGGSIKIKGTRYFVSPVIADKAISVEQNGLFIPLTRAKLNFERGSHNFMVNGSVQNHGAVVTSRIYNNDADKAKGPNVVRCEVSIIHYMFAQFGLSETLRRFCQIEAIVGGPELTKSLYPEKDWYIFSSLHSHSGTRPKAARRVSLYESCSIRLVIRKEDFNEVVRDYVASFFYVADHLPLEVNIDEVDDSRMWRLALGRIIKNQRSEGKLANEMDVHLASLSEYVDELSIQTFKRADIHVTDVWELFHYIVANMGVLMRSRRGNVDDQTALLGISSMFNKNLIVLRYILFDITYSIFMAMYKLAPDKRVLNFDSINETLTKTLKYDAIFKINSEKHGETATHQISGDNMFMKITGNIVQQTKANDGYSSDTTEYDPQLVLHSSQMAVASYLNQPKSNPTGRDCINPYIKLDGTDIVQIPTKHEDVLRSMERVVMRD